MEEELKEKFAKEIDKIKRCIAIFPNLYKHEVSLKTGVPIDIIRELIDAGILAEENSVLKIGKKRERFSSEKRAKFANELKSAFDDDREQDKSARKIKISN